LFVRETIAVVAGRCRTESYGYRLQTDDSVGSWLVRWEYHREPPRADYAYPAAHVHINGVFAGGQPAQRLHIPTSRVPIELVIQHLIAEWGVECKSRDWRPLLAASMDTRTTAA
jgi:hypothetical protein